jgi:hypothetical protein
MREIQESLGLTAVTISHNLARVRTIARRTYLRMSFSQNGFPPRIKSRGRPFVGHAPVMYLATIVMTGRLSAVSAPLPRLEHFRSR